MLCALYDLKQMIQHSKFEARSLNTQEIQPINIDRPFEDPLTEITIELMVSAAIASSKYGKELQDPVYTERKLLEGKNLSKTLQTIPCNFMNSFKQFSSMHPIRLSSQFKKVGIDSETEAIDDDFRELTIFGVFSWNDQSVVT